MMKVTVLYGHPASPEAFEQYYSGTHLPIAAKMKGVARIELTKFTAGPGGTKPAFYRMAELYFATQAQMEQTLGSPEGQAAVADLPRFATGGVTMVIGSIEG
ncbi:MAG: EthD family reductase [Candidatus Latescibacteria bacterium]|nr:EthD family reductase [Candidatus Latescibacterota bacterium]